MDGLIHSASSIYNRVEHIREILLRDNLKGLLIFTEEFRPSYSFYISDYRPVENIEFSPQVVYISLDRVVLFLGPLNMERARSISWIEDIRDIEELDRFFTQKGDTLGIAGIEKLPGYYQKVINRLAKHINFVPYDHHIDGLRLYKAPEEMDCLIQAAHFADGAVGHMLGKVQPGISTEKEIAMEGEFFLRTQGVDIGYDTIISGGLNTRDRTHRPKDTIVKRGDLLLINIVPRYRGYCSFVTVTKALDNPLGDEVCRGAQEVIAYVLRELREGDRASRIYELYYEKTKACGLLDHFILQPTGDMPIGHSTGLDVVEPPIISRQSDLILRDGMVISLKYALSNFEFGDVRFEFNIAVSESISLLNQSVLDFDQDPSP